MWDSTRPKGFDLSGRRALVTGAGAGVGAAIARQLVAAGALVHVNDIDGERAAATAASLEGAGGARPVKADVTSPPKVLRMREETGPVDILVNNAGMPTTGFELKAFVDTEPKDWEYLMWLNLGAVFHVTHAYVRDMVAAGWGRVLTIVSRASASRRSTARGRPARWGSRAGSQPRSPLPA
jgi:3-oxoacyl-[acyl-carrier protein] reductase